MKEEKVYEKSFDKYLCELCFYKGTNLTNLTPREQKKKL